MAPLSRAVTRWDALRVAAGTLGLVVLLVLAAYAFDLTSRPATTEGVLSALALVVLAGAGLLYAWRLGAGGIVE